MTGFRRRQADIALGSFDCQRHYHDDPMLVLDHHRIRVTLRAELADGSQGRSPDPKRLESSLARQAHREGRSLPLLTLTPNVSAELFH
jgi:hypothetical protein